AAVWSALEYSGVPGVAGVWQHGPFATIIAIKQHYGGHARQAAAIALGVRTSLALGRFIIVVDDDIDPSDLKDVFWAVTTRCDPATQTEILRDLPTSDINPRIAPDERAQGRFVASRIVIDACKPYRWLNEFPPSNVMSPDKKKQVADKWRSVLCRLGS
ncbi:MAG: UbiD family decarboxylase, partial [Deltaproteobacteria bacterium]|nr:UbiD family decarboxylase [Deltaproteobacteria bacterium]